MEEIRIQDCSVNQIYNIARDDGYTLNMEQAAIIQNAAKTGTLLWTSTKIVVTGPVRLHLTPANNSPRAPQPPLN